MEPLLHNAFGHADVQIHYVTAGTSDTDLRVNRTIMLLHDFPSMWWEWRRIIEPLHGDERSSTFPLPPRLTAEWEERTAPCIGKLSKLPRARFPTSMSTFGEICNVFGTIYHPTVLQH